jgi:5'-deoxynucleotidase YfbR-like HD superfamily hydrolase
MISFVDAWLSGKVRRKHTMENIHAENISEHTWGVVLLLLMLWPDARREIIIAAQLHDFGEKATGDMPGPTKWSDPVLETLMDKLERDHMRTTLPQALYSLIEGLTDPEWGLVELCDRAEFCVSMIHERMLGNRYAEIYYKRAWDKMTQTLELYRAEFVTMSPWLMTNIANMRRDLDGQWRKARS